MYLQVSLIISGEKEVDVPQLSYNYGAHVEEFCWRACQENLLLQEL